MFTGIIKEIGTVEEIRPQGESRSISIRSGSLYKEAVIGDSISVDGVCLTVADKKSDILYFDLIKETLKTTSLGYLKKGDRINLEPSLKADDRLGGHIVSGHIDEVGYIRKITKFGNESIQLMIGISPKSTDLLVMKGSVAVNGISLTVNGIGRDYFIVDIIPHTFNATNIGIKGVGARLNIEFDLIGKYALKDKKRNPISEDFLKRHGYILHIFIFVLDIYLTYGYTFTKYIKRGVFL